MKLSLIALLFGGIMFGLAPASRASEADKKMILTFPEPVEIPGHVLQPGRYVFERVDNRIPDVLKVTNPREDHLYAMFIALPIEREEPAGSVVVQFEERPTGQPDAIHAIYYPGDMTGEQFLYPKQSTVMTASVAENTETTSAPQPPAVAPPLTQREPEQQPAAEPQEMAQAAPSAPPAPEAAPEPAPSNMPTTLPHTSSPLALILLIGAGALGGGTGLKAISKNNNN